MTAAAVFANEQVHGKVKELYWGSHNSTHGDYVFTTFGDYDSMRVSFPDLVWHLRADSRLEIAESILSDMTDNYPQISTSLSNLRKPSMLVD
jgi:hypothetical protein